MTFMIQSILLAVGFLMLVKGADWFVDGSSAVARRFGIPQLVIGLTIVAMGTSAPEAAVSITAAIKGNADITIGNIVGSNILNILIILGLSSLLADLQVAKSTVRLEIPFMLGITAVLMVQGNDGVVGKGNALILLALFGLYLWYLFRMAKQGREEVQEADVVQPLWKNLAMTGIGLVLIVWGSNVTVDAATALRHERAVHRPDHRGSGHQPAGALYLCQRRPEGQLRHRHRQHRRFQYLQHSVRCGPLRPHYARSLCGPVHH